MNQGEKKGELGAFILGFVLAFLVGWFFFSNWFAVPPLYGKLEQPVIYDHLKHTEEAGMVCEDCHYFREDGTWSGIPKVEKCIECHEEPMGESPEEERFIKEYIEPGREVPWLIYSRQPKNVFFSHVAHTKLANMECKECHGEMGYTSKPPPYVYSRVSRYPQHTVMIMEDCMECHKKHKAKNYCFICHK